MSTEVKANYASYLHSKIFIFWHYPKQWGKFICAVVMHNMKIHSHKQKKHDQEKYKGLPAIEDINEIIIDFLKDEYPPARIETENNNSLYLK
jgi:hypothetical protein